MSETLIEQLDEYRCKCCLTYAQLAQKLEIPETYLYRWRKKNNISGIYAKYITLFLKDQEVNV